jgi:hypothetical protein
MLQENLTKVTNKDNTFAEIPLFSFLRKKWHTYPHLRTPLIEKTCIFYIGLRKYKKHRYFV